MESKHPKLFNNIYSLRKKINSGSFGTVYLGFNNQKKEHVAIKIEMSGDGEVRTVLREAALMKRLSGIKGIPEIYWAGTEKNCDVLVQKLLGKDLASLMKTYKKFSIKTVIMIAEQMLKLFEKIHESRIIHRDIKPDNIIMGRSSDYESLYLIDFGIAKNFMNEEGHHIKLKDGKPFIGTTRYASAAAHLGKELCRKDDLESLGYVLVFLLKGFLPWQNAVIQKKDNKEKIKAVGQIKLKTKPSELCKGLPGELAEYFEIVRNLKFDEKPDYHKLRALFSNLAIKESIVIDYEWDWFAEIKRRTKLGTNFTLDTFYKPKLVENTKSVEFGFPKNSRSSFHNVESFGPTPGRNNQSEMPFKGSKHDFSSSAFSLVPNYEKSNISGEEFISSNLNVIQDNSYIDEIRPREQSLLEKMISLEEKKVMKYSLISKFSRILPFSKFTRKDP